MQGLLLESDYSSLSLCNDGHNNITYIGQNLSPFMLKTHFQSRLSVIL